MSGRRRDQVKGTRIRTQCIAQPIGGREFLRYSVQEDRWRRGLRRGPILAFLPCASRREVIIVAKLRVLGWLGHDCGR